MDNKYCLPKIEIIEVVKADIMTTSGGFGDPSPRPGYEEDDFANL